MATTKKVIDNTIEDITVETKQTTAKDEISALKKMLSDERENNKQALKNMEKMFMELAKANLSGSNISSDTYNPMRTIKVISLVPNALYLTTEMKGMGTVYDFPKFGYQREIQYADLVKIVHNQRDFAEKGVFYICDEVFVAQHGLEDYYKNIITYDVLNSLLTETTQSFKTIIKTCNLAQFNVIYQMLLDSLKKDNVIGEDKIIAIQKEYATRMGEKVDIEEVVDNLKELSKKS